jgi:hypothetical protein
VSAIGSVEEIVDWAALQAHSARYLIWQHFPPLFAEPQSGATLPGQS